MACALTAGYTQDCRDSVGGVKEIKVIEMANVASFTETANVVTTVTNASTKRWWSYKPAKETVTAKSAITANVQNGTLYYAQEVSLAINKMQTSLRTELGNLAKNILYVAVRDANDKYWIYGYTRGLDVTGGETGTGTAPGDRNGYQLTLTGQEPADAIEISSTAWGTLEIPGT